jgi:hypothetical protein
LKFTTKMPRDLASVSMFALLLAGTALSPFGATQALALDTPLVAVALTSHHVAVSWATGSRKVVQVEYSQFPFSGPDQQGSLFPTPSLSPSGYTPITSLTHDLCIADLKPDTLYFVRARTMSDPSQTLGTLRQSPLVSAAVSVRTLPSQTPAAASNFTSTGWIGFYATDQWMVNKTIRANMVVAPYVRGAAISSAWSDIEPAPGILDFSVVDRALSTLEANGKYVKLALRGTSNINGKRIPDWVPDGVETVQTPDAEERSVKWDPTFSCRWWQFVAAYGRRYDERVLGRLSYVNVSGVGSSEMATTSKTLDAYRRLGYTDRQIEANVLWAWRNTLQVFAESFPHARLSVVPGSIPLAPNNDLGAAVVKAAVETYGSRLVLAHSGFSLDKHGFIIDTLRLYQNRAWIGGLTELPPQDSPDPVAVLQPLFEQLVFPDGFAFVTLHPDALGIAPIRWSDLQELKDYLAWVDVQFARFRAP